jgi:hypothetical protein
MAVEILRKDAWIPERLQAKRRLWTPKTPLGQVVYESLQYLPSHLAAELIDRVSSVVILHSSLSAELRLGSGGRLNYGEIAHHVVTTAGVNFLVDAWQGTVEPEILKYHGVGTGTNAEAVGDTALQTESTTALNPDSTRATGSLTEGASANIFRTVGTPVFDASAAITEHGILSQAATGGGTLWDRSVFSAINVVSGDSIQFTYDLTISSGG